jgi:predicted lipoprotein with Yx(FWY)xxD motif
LPSGSEKHLWPILALLATAALIGCGGDDSGQAERPAADSAAEIGHPGDGAAPAGDPGNGQSTGTRVFAAGSEFGKMIFGPNRQAIYIFENDAAGRSNCYGECAADWPPVFTPDAPRAGPGVDASLLGTTKRRDGRLQVTYAGKPLYYYAHEAPGEVRCHNVDLNGGFWWVIGPDGERRP